MTVPDARRIHTLEKLRAVIGPESPGTRTTLNATLDETARALIAASPFALPAPSDAKGRPDVSTKGDGPGSVLERTLLMPDQKDNRLIFGLQNILANPSVALIFLVPGTEETLRVHGRAELTADPELLARLEQRGKPAVLATKKLFGAEDPDFGLGADPHARVAIVMKFHEYFRTMTAERRARPSDDPRIPGGRIRRARRPWASRAHVAATALAPGPTLGRVGVIAPGGYPWVL